MEVWKGILKERRVSDKGMDPFFPYLFVMAMEVLSTLLPKMTEENSETIAHMSFAVDLFVFSYADQRSARAIKEVLVRFHLPIGLKLKAFKAKVLS